MFKNRTDAGQKLTEKIKAELSAEEIENTVLLAIPRGGIVVGEPIHKSLGVSIDCLVVKKIPAPQSLELAIGAIGEEGVVVWEKPLCDRLGVLADYQQAIVKEKLTELEDKRSFFRQGRPLIEVKNKIVIIVDDGVATGATVKVSLAMVENLGPAEIILAVPIIAKETLAQLKERFSRVIYLEAAEMLFSLDQFYEDFSQISDQEVKQILGGK